MFVCERYLSPLLCFPDRPIECHYFFIRNGIRAEHGKCTIGDMGSLGQFSPNMGIGNVYKNTGDTSLGRNGRIDMNNALVWVEKNSWNHTERGKHLTNDMSSLGQFPPKMGKQCRRNMQGALYGDCDDTHAALMWDAKFSWVVQNAANAQWSMGILGQFSPKLGAGNVDEK